MDVSRRTVLKGAAATGIGVAAVSGQAGASPSKHGFLELRRESYGTMPDGTSVDRYVFGNPYGVEVSMITYGATLTEIWVPDRRRERANVLLSLGSLDDFRTKSPYFGATIGRYANRIAGGQFELDGTTYQIPINNGPNALHGGPEGFSTKVWDAEEVRLDDRVGVRFSYVSPDGEMGFPGTLTTHATYTIDSCGSLEISYGATTDAPTIVNLTNHAYFNLAGEGVSDVYDQLLWINADRYTPIDPTSIPLGPLDSVEGTPYDFRRPKPIGRDVRIATEQTINGRGYDHNFVLNAPRHGDLTRAAWARDPDSGRELECLTTQPGVQFYGGNFLDGTVQGISDHLYRQGDAFCLETQHFPDSPNQPSYPSTVLRPGETFTSQTIYRFSTR